MSNNNELAERTIIIDIGEAYVKVGFTGEEKPTSVFPTIIGKPKFKHVMQTEAADSRELYVGDDCMNKRGVMKLSYPISRGNIMDWDSYYAILNHIFYNILRIDPSQTNVLYAENCLTPQETRQYIARLFFETFKCKSVYIANAPILALFSAGLVTGIIVESGEGLTRIVPIIEGRIIQDAVQRLPLAGVDVNENLKTLLLRTGIILSGTSALREILREIKDQNCFIALDPDQAAKNRRELIPYTLPDGEIVKIDMEIRVRAPEILFHPEIFRLPIYSIPQSIIFAISKIDPSYWREMLSHIVLTGGNTMFPGIELRLQEELNILLPKLGDFPKIKKKEDKIPQKPKMINMSGPTKIKDSCPKCGTTVNLQQTNVCPQCGASVNQENSLINISNLPSPKLPKKCPKCKKKIEKGSEFCPFCGKKLIPIIDSAPSGLKTIEVPPIAIDFGNNGAPEFNDSESFKAKNQVTIKIITPENRETAIFNGASILGSLNSFKELFVTYEKFLANPDSINLDFSQIL